MLYVERRCSTVQAIPARGTSCFALVASCAENFTLRIRCKRTRDFMLFNVRHGCPVAHCKTAVYFCKAKERTVLKIDYFFRQPAEFEMMCLITMA